MKKGFTLMELLVVIVIVSVISVSSVLVFGNIDDSTALQDRANIYKDIQRSAALYIDLENSWLGQFREKGYMYARLDALMDMNYVEDGLEDPVTGDPIPRNYLVKVYTAKDPAGNEYIDTCILNRDQTSAIFCNNTIRKCCNEEDKLAGADNCKVKISETEEVEISADEEKNCLEKPYECSCYSQKVCNIETCVANSEGEPFDCCLNSTD